MVRISVGVGLLAALLVTYWVNPTAAWVALFSTSTLALARHIRQRDEEAEAALQRLVRQHEPGFEQETHRVTRRDVPEQDAWLRVIRNRTYKPPQIVQVNPPAKLPAQNSNISPKAVGVSPRQKLYNTRLL